VALEASRSIEHPRISRPDFGTVHQRAADAQPAMVSIDDETGNRGERFGIDVFGKDDVHPSNGEAVHIRDEKLLVLSQEDPRQPVGRIRVRQVVAKLGRQLRDRGGV